MFPHTTEALALAAGVTVNTVLRWKSEGLLDGLPTTKSGGRAKGVHRMWSDEALQRVREIAGMKKRGFDMPAIRRHFNCEPSVVAERRAAEAQEKADAKAAAEQTKRARAEERAKRST